MLKENFVETLGTAITAGVAPLLFVQILYKESFYTANLLLFHRWMAILPVLIVAFYSLYWLKSGMRESWPRLTMLVRWIPLVSFLFVGWAWAENHMLMSERRQGLTDMVLGTAALNREAA